MLRTLWARLSNLLQHPRRKLFQVVLVSAAGGLAEAAVLVLIVRIAVSLNDGSPSRALRLPILGSEPTIGWLLWAGVGFVILGTILDLFLARLTARMSSEVLANSRSQAVGAFLRATWARQAQDREGALQETISTLAMQSSLLALTFASGLAAALNLLTLLVVATLVDPVAMIVVLLFGAGLFAALRPMATMTRRRAKLFVASNSNFAEEVSKISSLAMELQVFGVQETAALNLEALNAGAAKRQFDTRFASRFGSMLYRDVAVLFLVGALGGLYILGNGAITGVSTVIILVVRALSSAQNMQVSLQTLNEQSPNLDSLEARLRSLEESAVTLGNAPLIEFRSIEFAGMGYEYVPGIGALEDVSLRIEAGEIIGIIGPSGGGKSTFVQVLLRLRTPQTGTVTLNGEPYESFSASDWAKMVAFVPQEPKLMEASVADNITFLRGGFHHTDVVKAAEAAHVADEIRALRGGFDAQLGPRGGGLSGGQKQRVAIARAIVGRPQLLVLDEPTSALDVQSERLLQQTIANLKGSTTIVIVAHRLSTLQYCDRLLVLRNGRVEKIGTPDDLAREPGFYKSITTDLAAIGDGQ
jgi:ABC-type multidrug transport system fused ATPase/permease subunit